MQERARRQQNLDSEAMTTGQAGGAHSGERPRIDPESIARRAYERYEARGFAHGHDQEDWFEAERELKNGGVSPGNTTTD